MALALRSVSELTSHVQQHVPRSFIRRHRSGNPLFINFPAVQMPQKNRWNSKTARAETSSDDGGDMKEEEEEEEPEKPKKKRSSSSIVREKLRAARVVTKYAQSKAEKPKTGSKVLDALRESDRGMKKKPGLPEAPTNLFDDSKRGMPKKGLTFDFPGGNDLLIIVFSFVFISTVMFATTYFVWKVGAIHFNE